MNFRTIKQPGYTSTDPPHMYPRNTKRESDNAHQQTQTRKEYKNYHRTITQWWIIKEGRKKTKQKSNS